MENSTEKKTGTKTKRHVLAGVILLVVLGAAVFLLNMVFGIGNPVSRNSRAFSRAVKQWTAQAQDGDIIFLSELTPFSWSQAYTFDPYITKKEMEQVLGCSGRDLEETVSEGMVQLIFVDDDSASGRNKVVCCICGYGDSLGYGVDLGARLGTRANYVMLNRGEDEMTLRKRGSYPVLVFEGEIFEGTVMELYEHTALVSVEGEWPIMNSGNQVFVELDEEQARTAAVGDRLRVRYDGMVMESFPLQLGGQMSVELIK